MPSEQDVFLDKLRDSPSSEDLFTVPFDPTVTPSASDDGFTPDYPLQRADQNNRRISNTQALLMAGIAAVFCVLVYAVFFMDGSSPGTAQIPESNDLLAQSEIPPTTTVTTAAVAAGAATVQDYQPADERPLSRRQAETLYSEMAFARAYEAYHGLSRRLAQSRQDPALQDFLTLRMALCQKGMGQTNTAQQMLRSISLGHAPVVGSLARYHEALLLLHEDQYLDTATKAYQALALIDAVGNAPQWVQLYKRYCDYLINKAISTYALSLYDAERDLPAEIFTLPPVPDPFLHLNEEEFLSLLTAGRQALEQAMLGPRVSSVGPADATGHWRVVGNGASLEETLTRFVTHAGAEIDWSHNLDTSTDMIDASVRQRPVHVLLSGVSVPQATVTIAGCVGLFAHIDQGNTIRIRDPRQYKSASEHANVLTRRAIDLCQQFLFANEEPELAAHAYLALGLLQRHAEQVNEALAAFKQVFNRFSRHELAPYALLYSSRLKTDVGDLPGAREDLKLLVAQYPDAEFSGNAHIYLADATKHAGYWNEAIGLYRKVYNMNMSRQSRLQAAYGAGQCSAFVQDHEGVIRWFNRYEESLLDEADQTQLSQALLMQARAYAALDRHAQASDMFQRALDSDLSKPEYVEALAGYAEANRNQEKYLEALNRISAEHPWSFSYQERNRITLTKARVYQAMGLNSKAVALLEDQLSFLRDPNQLAEAHLQLARCYTLSAQLEQAKRACIQGLMTASTPMLINQLRFQLAQTALRLGQSQETIRHCQDILASDPKPSLKNRVCGLMAHAYQQDNQYEMALDVLLNQVPETPDQPIDAGDEIDTSAQYSMN